MQEYSKAFKVLMKSPVTDDMIRYVTNCTLKVMPNNVANHTSSNDTSKLPSLMTFISRIVRYTNVQAPTLLLTVSYLNKLKKLLPNDATGIPSTIHRLFLACLIISAKFHNDSSPLNIHWSNYSNKLFSLNDINVMERQLLSLLSWDLRLDESVIYMDLKGLLDPIVHDIVMSKHLRSMAYQRTNTYSRPPTPTSNSNNQKPFSFNSKHSDNHHWDDTRSHSRSSSDSTLFDTPDTLNSKNTPIYNKNRDSSISSIDTLIDSDIINNQQLQSNQSQFINFNSVSHSNGISLNNWNLEQVMQVHGF